MSDTTILNVKIDKTLKKQAQEVAKAVGLPISTVVTTGLREFVQARSITISDYPKLKPEVEAELLRLSKAARQAKDLSPEFKTTEEAIVWLKNQVKKVQKSDD